MGTILSYFCFDHALCTLESQRKVKNCARQKTRGKSQNVQHFRQVVAEITMLEYFYELTRFPFIMLKLSLIIVSISRRFSWHNIFGFLRILS